MSSANTCSLARISQRQQPQVKADEFKDQTSVNIKKLLEEESSNKSTSPACDDNIEEANQLRRESCSPSPPLPVLEELEKTEQSSPSKRRLYSGTMPSPVSVLTSVCTMLMPRVTEEVEVGGSKFQGGTDH